MTENPVVEEPADSSEESEDEIDKVTVIKAPDKTQLKSNPVIMDELEYQLEAEKKEAEKLAQGHYYTDPNDGTCYEWDDDKRAWFPRVTEDFLAAYQMSYGVSSESASASADSTSNTSTHPVQTPTSPTSQHPTTPDQTSQLKRIPKAGDSKPMSNKRVKKDPEWFEVDQDKNTWIYITGLPLAMSDDEFLSLVGKYGIVMEDPETERKKYKLYKDENGNFKGDAKCCYLRKESIPLAIQMLDGTKLSGSSTKLKIEKAKFELKGSFDPKLKPKKKKNNNKKNKKRNKQENLLDWRDRAGGDDLRPKHAKIVIMKHCFDPKEFLEDATLITDIRDDIKSECEKLGPVKKVLIFDRHPEGVVSIKFGTHEAADDAITKFNGRFFAGKQLEASIWDGVTDYAIEETVKEREQRLASWRRFIGDDESTPPSDPTPSSDPTPPTDTTPSTALTTTDIPSPQNSVNEVNGSGTENIVAE